MLDVHSPYLLPDEHNCKLDRVGDEREKKQTILMYGKSNINNDKLIELNIEIVRIDSSSN